MDRKKNKAHQAILSLDATSLRHAPVVPAQQPAAGEKCALRSRLLPVALMLATLPAQAALHQGRDYADLSLEELANIEITSVSKKSESLAAAPASVFVITADDIRRSGASSLPDTLRLAPNLQVAQSSASGYAISARGLNGSSNKLLVLIDGRSVYTPLFSGVFWDVQDVMLEDVERIEVISGPGATLWGVNAVNGVINVITRPARDTQGGLLAAGSGNRASDTAFRYGGTLGADGNYRVYGKYLDRRHSVKQDGSAVNDGWHKSQVGFRADWERPGNQFSLQGNAYDGAEAQPAPGTVSISGANLTSRWAHLLEDGSSLSLQAYYDHTERSVPPIFGEILDIIDVQLQHSLRPIGAHAVVWGLNYRYSMDHVVNSDYFAFLPADVDQKWGSLFAQDELTLRDDLRLTVGARIERNDYTGNEFLPSARLAWKFAPGHLLWTAASRTVRAPSRLDSDLFVPARPPFLLDGGRNIRSEVANVVEIGYRGQPTPSLSTSVTAFHAVYDHLRTVEAAPSGTTHTVGNEMEGSASGIEMWGAYQVSPLWRLSAGYTALRERFRLKPGSNDRSAPNAAGKDPAHTWQLRSTLNIAPEREFDLVLRHVAALSNPDVPAYTAVDARFGWQLRRDLELSVTGQNLFGSHAEYGPGATRSEIPAAIFVKLLWQI